MDRLFTIPNQLTFLRIVLVPLFVTFVIYRMWGAALVTFVVAAATDALDGYLARRLNQRSYIGTLVDPLADKVLMGSSYVLLAQKGLIPPWLAVLVLSRDVLIVGGVVLLKLFSSAELAISPSLWGKLTTLFQVVTVVVVLCTKVFGCSIHYAYPLYLVTSLLTVVSGYLYFRQGWEAVNGGVDNGG